MQQTVDNHDPLHIESSNEHYAVIQVVWPHVLWNSVSGVLNRSNIQEAAVLNAPMLCQGPGKSRK